MSPTRERKPNVTRPRSLKKTVEPPLGFTWGPLNSLFMGLGLVALTVGYVTLSKGSLTLAPLLLAVGYCVLIPTSLLIRGRTEGSGE